MMALITDSTDILATKLCRDQLARHYASNRKASQKFYSQIYQSIPNLERRVQPRPKETLSPNRSVDKDKPPKDKMPNIPNSTEESKTNKGTW